MNVRNTDPDGRRIKIALGLAAAAIFGVKALTGRPAENSSRTFDICVEDFKVFNVIAQVTFLNHDPMPADLHDEAIVRGTLSTVAKLSDDLSIAQPYQGDEGEDNGHVTMGTANNEVVESAVV